MIEKQCPECHSVMLLAKVQQEFEKEGIRVVVSGIPAWKCPNCGTVSYRPEIADHVLKSAKELLQAAKMGETGYMSAEAI